MAKKPAAAKDADWPEGAVIHAVWKDGKQLGVTKPHVCIGASCQEPAN
jgi:hypothetical protein